MKRRLLFVMVLLILSGLSPSAPVLADVSSKLDGKIAFTSNRTGNYEIYVMDADGSNIKQLTDGAKSPKYMLSWSPDGNYLFYVVREKGQPPVTIVTAIDGSYQRIIGEYILESRLLLSFAPDGQQFIFGQNLDGGKEDTSGIRYAFFISDIRGNKTKELPFPQKGVFRVGFLSNDRLLIVGREGPYSVNLYSTNLFGYFRRTLSTHVGASFSVSPNGERIAANTMDGLITLDIDGNNRVTIGESESGKDFSQMEWSPDSQMLWVQQFELVQSSDPKKSSELHFGVYTLNADGSNRTKISSELTLPSWSPDSQYLTYSVTEGEKRQIVIARPDGTIVNTFTSNSDDFQPVWQPKSME